MTLWFRNMIQTGFGFFACFSHVEENLSGLSFLSASFTSWENYCFKWSQWSFLQHFLLSGILKVVGVFLCNRKYFDIKSVSASYKIKNKIIYVSGLFTKSEKMCVCVWEADRLPNEKKGKDLFLYLSCKQYVTHNLTVVPRSGKCFGTFFSS